MLNPLSLLITTALDRTLGAAPAETGGGGDFAAVLALADSAASTLAPATMPDARPIAPAPTVEVPVPSEMAALPSDWHPLAASGKPLPAAAEAEAMLSPAVSHVSDLAALSSAAVPTGTMPLFVGEEDAPPPPSPPSSSVLPATALLVAVPRRIVAGGPQRPLAPTAQSSGITLPATDAPPPSELNEASADVLSAAPSVLDDGDEPQTTSPTVAAALPSVQAPTSDIAVVAAPASDPAPAPEIVVIDAPANIPPQSTLTSQRSDPVTMRADAAPTPAAPIHPGVPQPLAERATAPAPAAPPSVERAASAEMPVSASAPAPSRPTGNVARTTSSLVRAPVTATPASSAAASTPLPAAAPLVHPAVAAGPAAPVSTPALPTAAALRARANVAFRAEPSAVTPAPVVAAAPTVPTLVADAPADIAPVTPSAPAEPLALPVSAAPSPTQVESVVAANDPLPVATDGQWIEAMIERIETLREPSGLRETRIRLAPDALGQVEVRLVETADGLAVQLTTDNPAARQLLAEAAPRLTELAEQRGLKLADPGQQAAGEQRQQRQAQPERAADARNHFARAADDEARDDTDHRIA